MLDVIVTTDCAVIEEQSHCIHCLADELHELIDKALPGERFTVKIEGVGVAGER